ncbi:carotenoid biosynthesis protein [Lentzea californiensis]|uniref:carotenoid biosynthesis protein n=1 Tax=Lentzea californiensis TaxID=438851 RepID=UPI0021662559|nr:carotenoid biosynthesis protein [Lentzea californiensis]MCR3750684.1 putative membrane protein [Lentzea californiensis]
MNVGVERGASSVAVHRSAGALRAVAWICGALVVLAQIIYSMTEPEARLFTTVASVIAFAVASVCDALARFGPRAAGLLVAIAGGGGLLAETIGVHTGFPFGDYRYTGTLGLDIAGVPVVVALAWVMMCWPALLVGRALATRLRVDRPAWLVVVIGAWALASWDVFLDPQMVDAGHWVWADPSPALPGVDGVPLTNYAGWLLVAVLMITALHWSVGGPRVARELDLRAGPAPVLYLWTYGSSVWAHAAFFDRASVSLVAGLLMGVVAVPFAWTLWRAHR